MSDTVQRDADARHSVVDEDPLAELARIVAGDIPETPQEQSVTGDQSSIDHSAQHAVEAGSEPVSHSLEQDFQEMADEQTVSSDDFEAEMAQALASEAASENFEPTSDQVAHEETAPAAVSSGPAENFEDDLINALQDEIQPAANATPEASMAFDEELEAIADENLGNDVPTQDGLSNDDLTNDFEDAFSQMLVEEAPASPIENSGFDAQHNDAAPHVEYETSADAVANVDQAAAELHDALSLQDFDPSQIAEPEMSAPVMGVAEDIASVEAAHSQEPSTDAAMEAEFGDAFAQELNHGADAADHNWQYGEAVGQDEIADPAQAFPPDYGEQTADHSIYMAENQTSTDVHEFGYQEPEPQRSSGLKYAVVALLVALFAGGAVAGYGYFGGGETTNEPVLVKADADPVKVKPENPGGRQVANQDNASFQKVDGKSEKVDQPELVSQTEKPAQIASSSPNTSTNNVKSDDRLTKDDGQSQNASGRAGNVRPRVVKTVRVRPDGSIVANQSAAPIAVAQAQPAAPATTQATPAAPTSIDGAISSGKPAVPAASPVPKPVVSATPKPVAPKPAAVEAPTSIEARAPQSEWVVQVSSVKTPAQADATFANLQRKFAVLSDRSMGIQKATVNGGTFYRVRVNTASKSDANSLCSNLKSAGGSCFVTR